MKTKMIYLVWLVFLVCSSVVYATDLPDSLFPWGAYSAYFGGDHACHRAWMRDSLGFNLINLTWNGETTHHVTDFMDSGMVVYPCSGPIIDSTNYFQYARAHYSLIEAEDYDRVVRFRYKNGDTLTFQGALFWAYEDTTANSVLWGMGIWQESSNATLGQNPTEYKQDLRMMIDIFDTLLTTDTVAYLFTTNNHLDFDTTTKIYPIMASEFYDSLGGEFLLNTPLNIDCGSYELKKNSSTYFRISSTGKAKLYFDYIKIYCDEGKKLIDDGDYDNRIKESVASAVSLFGENVAGWYMAEEPHYCQFRPIHYIDSLIMDTTYSLGWPDTARAVSVFAGTHTDVTPDFIALAQPEVVWADIYAFGGGGIEICGEDTTIHWFTDYTGYYEYPGSNQRGLQKALEDFTEEAETAYEACTAASIDWWLMPQAWGFLGRDYDTCSFEGWSTRMPTKSELSCSVYLGLCYGARGIVFWRYHDGVYAHGYMYGLIDQYYAPTHLWHAVKEMNPYIKAIENTYLELTWVDADYASPTYGPDISLINSITVVANDPDSASPDIGWFHVAEFHDDSNDKYFMLVNRACSKDSIGTEAPPVTAVVELNPTVIGSDFVFIIDIAKGTNAANWVGYPDTTYAAATNGGISYSTTLEAGEGRLYKVVPTNEKW